MTVGGGTFTKMNKVLPGVYVRTVNAQGLTTGSERGVVACPMVLNYGPEGKVIELTATDFRSDSRSILGYEPEAEELKDVRELLANASKVLIYRIGESVKAANDLGTAKYGGVRGNALKIAVSEEVSGSTFRVRTYLGEELVDEQKNVATAADLKDNSFIAWKPAASLIVTAGLPLEGGSNASLPSVAEYQSAFDALESQSFSVLAVPSKDTSVIELAVAYTKRMREEVGSKFQTVVYRPGANSDYEGVIDVATKPLAGDEAALVYWVAGLCASVELSQSATNKPYTGEYSVDAQRTSAELEAAILGGKFILHQQGDEYRVLSDVNSLLTLGERSSEYKRNQTIRIIDEYVLSVARVFIETYLGAVPNDVSGRVSLWNSIVNIKKQLQKERALDEFDAEDTQIERGDKNTQVVVHDSITPLGAMEQLYVTVVVN